MKLHYPWLDFILIMFIYLQENPNPTEPNARLEVSVLLSVCRIR